MGSAVADRWRAPPASVRGRHGRNVPAVALHELCGDGRSGDDRAIRAFEAAGATLSGPRMGCAAHDRRCVAYDRATPARLPAAQAASSRLVCRALYAGLLER